MYVVISGLYGWDARIVLHTHINESDNLTLTDQKIMIIIISIGNKRNLKKLNSLS
jgi:hypothetical protein